MIFLLVTSNLFSQQDMVVEGNYWGKNIYIFNPYINGHSSISKITVNNVVLDSVFNSNSYVVDLSKFALSIGQPLIVSIQHNPAAEPFISNMDAIAPSKDLSFDSFKHNKKENNLSWSIKEFEKGKIYDIEQFLWGKWQKVKDIGLADTLTATSYMPLYHSGLNLFRIKQSEKKSKSVAYTKSIKVKQSGKEVYIINPKTIKILEFSEITMYEIIDVKGKILKTGKGKEINIESFPKGEYWINFDNKTEGFLKK